MRKFFVFGLIIAVIGAGTWYLLKKDPIPPYKTEAVRTGDLVSAVTATGTVNAVKTVLVGTQVSGTIKKLYVDYNSKVKEGQLLAQIDPATFQAQVDQAGANLLNAQANLKKNEASLVDAQRIYKRNRELIDKHYVAQSDLDTSETNVEMNKAQVDVAKAQVLQNKAALNQAETSLHYTRILSPVNGIVISRSVDIGQTVAASFQTPTLFTIAEDLTKMQIDTSVDEADVSSVKENQEVRFTVDAYPDTNFIGTVSEIRNAAVIVQNVVTYDVVVHVNNKEMKLKPGMTANVSIVTSSREGVLLVPNSALRFRPKDIKDMKDQKEAQPAGQKKPVRGKGTSKGMAVWVMENNKPKRVSVKTGITDGSYTEIVSGPLKEGQEVITAAAGQVDQSKQSTQGAPRLFH
jgi:HlyD family secretion protein